MGKTQTLGIKICVKSIKHTKRNDFSFQKNDPLITNSDRVTHTHTPEKSTMKADTLLLDSHLFFLFFSRWSRQVTTVD
jgi:hypothetical protein